MDLHQLESQIHANKSLQTKQNYDELISHYLADFDNLTPQEKYKIKDKISNYIKQAALIKTNTQSDLKYYLDCFQKIKAEPRFSSKIVAKYFEMIGGEPKKIAGKQGVLSVESGTITLTDISFTSANFTSADLDQQLINAVNQGQAFLWSTGGDGTYDIILRVIDGPEPTANPKEYRHIVNSSPIATIQIKSGFAVISDLGLEVEGSNIKIALKNGNYKVQVHRKYFIDRFDGYVVILCPTTDPAANNFNEIVSIE